MKTTTSTPTNLIKLKNEIANLDETLASLNSAQSPRDVDQVERKAFMQSAAITNFAMSLQNELPALYREARNQLAAHARSRAAAAEPAPAPAPTPEEFEEAPKKVKKAKKAKKTA